MPRYLVPPERPVTPAPGAGPARYRLGPADLAAVARMALDRNKLYVAFAGLVLAALAFFLFASLGNVIGHAVWRAIFRYLGGALAYLVLTLTCFLLARLAHFEFRTGGVRTGIAENVRYCLTRLWALCFTPGGLALVALVGVGLIGLIAWLGRIVPTVFAFLYLVEAALGVVVVLAAVVLTWGLFLYPAILAAQGTDELDTVRALFSLYRSDGIALAFYELVAAFLTWVAAVVPGLIAALALIVVRGIASPTMAGAFTRSCGRVPLAFREVVETWWTAVANSLRWLTGGIGGAGDRLGLVLGEPLASKSGDFAYRLSGVFLGFWLVVVVAATLAYALVFFVTAGMRVYLAYARTPPNASAEQRAAA